MTFIVLKITSDIQQVEIVYNFENLPTAPNHFAMADAETL